MSKTTFAALATTVIAVATMGAPTAEAGKYHGHGHGFSKHYKSHYGHGYGYRHWGHNYGHGYKYGKCAVWSHYGQYCVKWW